MQLPNQTQKNSLYGNNTSCLSFFFLQYLQKFGNYAGLNKLLLRQRFSFHLLHNVRHWIINCISFFEEHPCHLVQTQSFLESRSQPQILSLIKSHKTPKHFPYIPLPNITAKGVFISWEILDKQNQAKMACAKFGTSTFTVKCCNHFKILCY